MGTNRFNFYVWFANYFQTIMTLGKLSCKIANENNEI